MKSILAWHFLSADRRLQWGSRTYVPDGCLIEVQPPLVMCERGLHASTRLIDALGYAPGPICCRVRLSGEIRADRNKHCATRREAIASADVTDILYEAACLFAETALNAERATGREVEVLAAASAAAWEAARAAASAAASAAANEAARAAAWEAWEAARAAARAAQNEILLSLLPACLRF